MKRLALPTIIDSPEFRFPAKNHTTGQSLREIWRQDGETAVRVRMRDLKKGDLFYVRSCLPFDDSEHDEGCDLWMVAETDAWWRPDMQDWGITAHPYEPDDDWNQEGAP